MRQESKMPLKSFNSPKVNHMDTEVQEVTGKELKTQMIEMFEKIKEETYKQILKMFSELEGNFNEWINH